MGDGNQAPPLYSIFIINKSGGLIYHKRKVRLTSNSYLQIAGVFHGMYAITSQLAPTKEVSSGIRSMEADCMKLRCFQSVTGMSCVLGTTHQEGTKFIITTELSRNDIELDEFLSQLYSLYADYVLKNPFYDLEQPIHNCDKFQINLNNLIESMFAR